MESEKLLKETEWLKVYRVGEKELRYESKCLTEGVQIPAEWIKRAWATLTTEERLEFTIAFDAIPKLSTEDEEILNFLMESGEEAVLSNLASQYAKHSDRERVLPFLLGQIKSLTQNPGNFFQALEQLGDKRAVPDLKSAYDEYRVALENDQLNRSQVLEYLQCCRSLMKLDGSAEFRGAIQDMLSNQDEMVRRRAAQLLAK